MKTTYKFYINIPKELRQNFKYALVHGCELFIHEWRLEAVSFRLQVSRTDFIDLESTWIDCMEVPTDG